MKLSPLLVGTVLLAIALAGCTDSTDATPKDSGPTQAPQPSTDSETGSVTGRVYNEELMPIANAQLALVEAKLETLTDATGNFTFNKVPPGKHRLIAQALGYNSVARQVTVAAGEVTTSNFDLSAIPLEADPWHDSQVKTSYLTFDQEWVSFVFILANQNWSTLCGTCIHTVHLAPGPLQVLVENVWDPYAAPVINERISIWWRYYDPAGAYHNALETYSNRESRFMPDEEEKELRDSNSTKFTMSVHSDLFTVSINHRIDTWNTFAYVGELPEGYTALPPA
jgi:hypothetical protein